MRKALAAGASRQEPAACGRPTHAVSWELSAEAAAAQPAGAGVSQRAPSPGCDGRSGETTGLAGRGCQGAHPGGTAAEPPVRAPEKQGQDSAAGRAPSGSAVTPAPRVRPVLSKLCPRRKRGGRREGRATHSPRSWGSPGADARLSKAPQSPRGAGGLLVSRGASPAPAATWLGRGRSNVTLLLGSVGAGGCGSLPWPSAFCFQSVAQ